MKLVMTTAWCVVMLISLGASAAAEDVPAPPDVGPLPFVAENGWVGPRTELAGSWDDKLQNCMSVRTSFANEAFDGASSEARATLRDLHAVLLSQWLHQKRVVREGCDQAFGDMPILSQCNFVIPFEAIRTDHLDDTKQALLVTYRGRGAVLFGYKYYNPETALDDPEFEQRCKAIDGEWTAVEKDSSAYKEAIKLYEAKAGSTQQPAEPVNLEDLFRPTR